MRTLAVIRYVFALVGIGLLIGAALSAVHTRSFLAHAIRAQGTVVALVPHYSNHSSNNRRNNAPTYAPVVRFSHGGQVTDFTASTSSNPPSHHVGETVPVLYLDSAPFQARLDSFFSLWGATVVLGPVGLIFLLVGGLLIFRSRSQTQADDRLEHG